MATYEMLYARVSNVTLRRLTDAPATIRDGREYKAYIYAAQIARDIIGKSLCIVVCSENAGGSASLNGLKWSSIHLRTYRTLEDLDEQVPIAWDRLGEAQYLTVGVYDDYPDPELLEMEKLRTGNSRSYNSKEVPHLKVTLESMQPKGPRGLSCTDLPKETTLVPAIEFFNTTLELY